MIKYLLILFSLITTTPFSFTQKSLDKLDKLYNDVAIGKPVSNDINKAIQQADSTLDNSTLAIVEQLKNSKKKYYLYSLMIFLFIVVGVVWLEKKKYIQTGVIQETKELEPEEVNIAKQTEDRLVKQIQIFEKDQLYLTKNISISLMANLLNTNAKYITYILNKMYGQDFYTYINTLKIDYITDLLDNDPQYREYKISYLAEITTFSTHSKFTEVFKKINGCSPSEYIDKLKKT